MNKMLNSTVKHIRFIVNPISGVNRNPQKILKWVYEIFEGNSLKVDHVFTEGPGDGTRLAGAAVEEKVDLVVAVGGDGTINEIGRGLVNSRTALGVVPAGSGNGFARNFKIPLEQRQAIEMLKDPVIQKIDVGKINQHYFFNVAGAGLDAEIGHRFEHFGMRGPIPYFITGTKAFFEYRPQPLKIRYLDEVVKTSPMILSIANLPQYGNGAIIAPEARADDGLLDLVLLEKLPLTRVLPNLYRLFNGTINRVKGYHDIQIKKAVIERPAEGYIHTDGNPHLEGARLEIEVVPQALMVAVPPND